MNDTTWRELCEAIMKEQDTNKLLVAMLEQQLLTTERNRTSNVGSINTELYRQQHFSDVMSFTSSMPNRLQAPGSK